VSAGAAALLIAGAALQPRLGAAIIGGAFAARAGTDATSELPDGLHVALCGTGAPLPDPSRAGPCTAIIAGKHLFVVDAGDGAARNIALMGLPTGRVEAVFLTHLHSDHFDGLGPVMLMRWTGAAATRPLPVHGPPGVERVVAGFRAAYTLDAGYRTAHHGEAIAPPAGHGGEAMVFTPPPRGSNEQVTVYEGDRLRVTAFRVDHGPVDPAVGYRFDYKGRSVVVSGDTAASPALVANARGADILVHEALQPRLVEPMTRALAARGLERTAQITRDILDYHASPETAADHAQAAGVRHLLLTHVLPPLPFRSAYAGFLGDARRRFDGAMTVGEDGMMFSLPAGSDEIGFTRLRVD
jgi:ribonuclease Z